MPLNMLESLYDEAHSSGISVENFDLTENPSVCACIDGRYYIGIDKNRMSTSYEEAECLAHELGHCRTDAFYELDSPSYKRSSKEKKAQTWAILRIVTPERFRAAYESGCREVWEFAEELNISCDFAHKVMLYYHEKGFGCLG